MKETSYDHVAGAPNFFLDSVPIFLEFPIVLGCSPMSLLAFFLTQEAFPPGAEYAQSLIVCAS